MSGMKYRDPETGKVFVSTFGAVMNFCGTKSTQQCLAHGCPLERKGRGNGGCVKWAEEHPTEAAHLMGYEVIEDTQIDTPTTLDDAPTEEDDMGKQGKPRPAEACDAVNHPAHYTQGGIECIEALKAATREGLGPSPTRPAEAGDAVNHPAHYTQGGIECIEALKAATAGLEGIEAVCTANAIKYLWRWKHKGGVQDLDKAIWYIKRLKEEMERSERDGGSEKVDA